MLVELCTDIDRCRLDGLEEHLCDTRLLDVYQVRLEHAFWRLEPLGSDFDYTAIGELWGIIDGTRTPSNIRPCYDWIWLT